MTMNKRFTIDVEETTQENALFENDKFVCFEDDTDEYLKKINELADENEGLKQELFESEKEWYECHYADNLVRLDSKLEALKGEFKERFGRDFE